mgnify:FL=1
MMYEFGEAVKKDDVMAYMFYALSSVAGNKKAVKWREDTGERLTKKQIKDAQDLARDWVQSQYKKKKQFIEKRD